MPTRRRHLQPVPDHPTWPRCPLCRHPIDPAATQTGEWHGNQWRRTGTTHAHPTCQLIDQQHQHRSSA